MNGNSVGTAIRCYLLVRGTNNGQRRLAARKTNCTERGRSTALAEEITPISAAPSTDRIQHARFHRKNSRFLPIWTNLSSGRRFRCQNQRQQFLPLSTKGQVQQGETTPQQTTDPPTHLDYLHRLDIKSCPKSLFALRVPSFSCKCPPSCEHQSSAARD